MFTDMAGVLLRHLLTRVDLRVLIRNDSQNDAQKKCMQDQLLQTNPAKFLHDKQPLQRRAAAQIKRSRGDKRLAVDAASTRGKYLRRFYYYCCELHGAQRQQAARAIAPIHQSIKTEFQYSRLLIKKTQTCVARLKA